MIKENINNIKLSKEALNIIHDIRIRLETFNENNKEKVVYVSDRRWKKISDLLKTAAYLCNRKEVIAVDTLIISSCIWSKENNRKDMEQLVQQSVKENYSVDQSIAEQWVKNFETLDKEIQDVFYYSEDIYGTEDINGIQCCSCDIEVKKGQYLYSDEKIKVRIYVPIKYINTNKSFYVLNENGNEETRIKANFNGGIVYSIFVDDYVWNNGWKSSYGNGEFSEQWTCKPWIKIKKGDQKEVTQRTKSTYLKECEDMMHRLIEIIQSVDKDIKKKKIDNNTPFVNKEKQKIILEELNNFKKELQNYKLNAEHQYSKVDSYAFTK